MYAVRGEGSFSEVQELITQFIVTFDDKASVDEDKSMAYGEGQREAVTFVLEIKGVNIITCTQKTTKLCSR